ncbi:MAG: DUF4261 domain-containing protein [Myxococcales bacterium]|nr:DUF4261 domain-containing protein [Myxococcales bacterium]
MTRLSFVLLDASRPPAPGAIEAAYGELFEGMPPLERTDTSDDVLAWTVGDCSVFVSVMQAPIPTDEAQSAARFSIAAFGPGGPVDTSSHEAHLMVTSLGGDADDPMTSLWQHTRVVAAVAKACGAMAVYEGNAAATHPTAFYVDVASAGSPPMMLWTGLSVARETDGCTSLLTLGLGQLSIPNLWVIARPGEGNDAMVFALDLALYTAGQGQIPEGQTVGRTDDERVAVRYVDSPNGSGESVALVDLRNA